MIFPVYFPRKPALKLPVQPEPLGIARPLQLPLVAYFNYHLKVLTPSHIRFELILNVPLKVPAVCLLFNIVGEGAALSLSTYELASSANAR